MYLDLLMFKDNLLAQSQGKIFFISRFAREISSFEVDGILGRDTLKPHKVNIDLERGKIRYDGIWVPCLGSHEEEQICILTTDVIVQSRCMALIEASVTIPQEVQIVEPFRDGLVWFWFLGV